MEIRFNVTGEQRKALVTAITEVLNTPKKYLGAPTFAYEVGNCKIDKTGTLTGEITQELLDILLAKGFNFDAPEGNERIIPIGSKAAEEEVDRLTIKLPLDGFNETALNNLEKLVASKSTLIKKALGASELPIERTGNMLVFPWFSGELSAEEVNSYAQFITALATMAKEQKRITAKEKSVYNEKYTFRCFLLRLGFIGVEYATSRKILLANLSGNSSFKSGERKQHDTDIEVAI